ncbi:MAG TPA: Ig-like domain-containing protein [Pyrinomonadaceae bacterium]|nr:Ig-like domain-containing protein [Pyrinomonadaceae bacterium]
MRLISPLRPFAAFVKFKRSTLASLLSIFLLTALAVSFVVQPSSALTNNGSVVSFGSPLTENFDTLATAGTTNAWSDDSTIGGLYAQFAAVPTNPTIYIADAGTSNTGGIHSYGTGTSTERAIGGVGSNATGDIFFGFKLTNNTGQTITSLDISYNGEQWRNGGNAAAQQLDFQYQIAGPGVITDANSPATGWTDFDSLDFVSPITGATAAALDGNAAANRTAKAATIALSVGAGQEVWLRWKDTNDAGNDHGLAVDDFSVTANGVVGDTAPTVTATSPVNGAITVAVDSNISITFSESVNATTSSFIVDCPTGSPQAFTLSASPSAVFTLDPNVDFPFSTTCTVTVLASQISDLDANDPPDNMASNFVFSFTTAASPPVVANNVIINELDSDTPGADAAEFVELYDGGVGNTSLTGLVVVFYNGSNDQSYRAIDLDGFSTNAAGYFTIGNAAVSGVDLTFPNNTLQNGEDAVALYAANATDFPNGTIVTTANLRDAVVYDTADADDPGLLVLLNAGQPQVDESSGTAPDVDSIGRCPNGDGGARNTSTYVARTPTPDGANNCPPPAVAAAIHDIQGNGAISPFNGLTVTTTGIVTGRKSNGFFMQDPNVDADPNTSEGIFVFTAGAPPVAVGDAVTVTGTATEFFNLTQVSSSASNVTVSSSGNPLPAPITLTTTILDPNGPFDQLEKFEGMRVHADTVVSVAATNEFGEIFTVLDGVARPMREPGIEASLPVPPDPTSGMVDCCIPRWDQNPERIMVDTDGLVGSTRLNVTSNVTLTNITGPLDFTFDDYKITPETTPSASPNMSAVPVPTPVAGEFTVAGFNIENFNNNATQRAKAALAIRDVLHLPDIIGTIEIFDLADLEALAAEIETISGVHYEARLVESDGTSEDSDQDVGFLVKTSRVQINSVIQDELAGCNGTPANCNTYIDPDGNPALLNDRPPLILHATVDAASLNPRQVIVVVNHLRSFIDIELVTGDGPRVRAKRKAQGEFLANLLQNLQTGNPGTPVLSIGDYNAYQFNDGYTDPIATIKGTPTADEEMVVDASPDLVNPNFVNLTDTLPADQRYSFIFEGTPQALDHFIINDAANAILQRYHIARNNTDFPEGALFAGNASTPERNSDHDMPVGYFKFPNAATTTTVSDATAAFSTSNQNVALSANVTTSAGIVNDGTVTFTVRNSSSVVIGAPVVGNVSGGAATASYTLPGGTPAGSYTITGEFSGGAVTAASSDTATLSVTAVATTTTVADKTVSSSASNQNVALSANVTSSAGIVNDGTVTFTVRNSSNVVIGVPVVGNVSGGVATANYTLPGGTPAGTYTITGAFSGGAGTTASSDTATLTVTSGFSVTLSITPSTIQRGKIAKLNINYANNTGARVNVSFTIKYTSPCGNFTLSNLGPIPVSARAHGSATIPFLVPKKACTGLYTLTLESRIGGVLVSTTTATLNVTP